MAIELGTLDQADAKGGDARGEVVADGRWGREARTGDGFDPVVRGEIRPGSARPRHVAGRRRNETGGLLANLADDGPAAAKRQHRQRHAKDVIAGGCHVRTGCSR